MKILAANKFYYLKGGAERHFFNLNEMLKERGHKIIPFAMQDKRNIPSPYEKYFVSNVNLEKAGFSVNDTKAAGRIIYSFEARRKINNLIDKYKPDIAHVHNIYHQISPSILTAIKKRGIPVVMTVHDFKLMCPIYIFYTQGKVCERCKKYRYYNCILRRCAKNSYLASKLNATEMYIHRLLKIYKNNIDAYISPSKFVKNKLVEYGFDQSKIFVLPHFVKYESIAPNYETGGYILYFGRLSKEKGVKNLILAMKKIKNKNLKIAGSGPQEKKLKNIAKQEGLKNIEFLGYLSGDKLKNIIQNSLFTVLPSVSYESFGMTVLESYMHGKPVVASNSGALPEIVWEGETGYIFNSENLDDLSRKLILMFKSDENIQKMGARGRKIVERVFPSEKYYHQIQKIYNNLL